jgi:hypothetical protein
MSTAIGYGTTFTWDGDPVGILTRIGPVSISVSKVDSTDLTAADAFKTMLPGLLDPGDVDLEGWFRPDDTGQAGMLADMLSRTVKEFIITFPTTISSSTWTGNAYVTAFTAGDATPEGIVPWSAKISITGKPVLGVTASTGMTVMTGIEETGTAALVILPTVGAAVYTYVADPIDTASTWVKLTVTAAGVITATVLGVEHVLTTTVQSEALLIDAAGEVTPIYIKVQEALKSPRNYTLYIQRP